MLRPLIASLLTAHATSISIDRRTVTNRRFDPDDDTYSQYCDLPPYQDGAITNAFEICSLGAVPTRAISEPQIQSMAERFAPYLFFHPLENWTMSSVNRTFHDPTRGKIYMTARQKDVFDETLNQTSLMRTTRDRDLVLISSEFMFEHDLQGDYKNGDGFNEEGISNAPIYYKAYDSENGTITINYFMWYPWNGPLGMSLVSSYNGTNQYIPFQQPPWGEHEGDWESMSVTVCVRDLVSLPVAVTYRQRNYGQTLDCTLGECTFYKETSHPVGFVALDSHSVYPITATELVWHEIADVEFFVNIQAVLLVDRLAFKDGDGKYRHFAPNGAANVLKLAEQDDIPENVDESEFWGAFAGRWGRTAADLPENFTLGKLPLCLENKTTLEHVRCPTAEENPPFLTLMQMLGVNSTRSPLIKGARAVFDYLLDEYSSTEQAPKGPAVNTFYSSFDMPSNADIWKVLEKKNLDVGSYCASLADIPDTSRLPVDNDRIPFIQNILGVVGMFLFFTVFNIFVAFLRKVSRLKPPIRRDPETGHLLPPGRATRRWVFQNAWYYTFALLLSGAGAVLFFTGIEKLSDLVRMTFNFELLSHRAYRYFVAVGSFNLVSNMCLLIVIWFSSQELWLSINRKYFSIVGDEEMVRRYQWENRQLLRYFVRTKHLLGETSMTVLFSLLMVGLVLSVMMVAVGVYHVGLAYLFGSICRHLVGSLDGRCFYFPGWSDDGVNCGSDFHQWCRDWARYEMMATLWGGFGVVVGNYYLIIFSVFANQSIRNVGRMLMLYDEGEGMNQVGEGDSFAAAGDDEDSSDGIDNQQEDQNSSANASEEYKLKDDSSLEEIPDEARWAGLT